jgi:hypothetical protein
MVTGTRSSPVGDASHGVSAADTARALQLHAKIAELTAREALARKTTVEHLLAARDIEIALSRRSRSPSPPSPPDRRLSPMHRLPSGTSEKQQMLQFFEEQRREDGG